MQNIAILGSTGSVGRQTADVVQSLPDYFRIYGICAKHDSEALRAQARLLQPAVVACEEKADCSAYPANCTVLCGSDAAAQLVQHPEVDVCANMISGIAALKPLICAIQAGKKTILANKECIVGAYSLILAAQQGKQELIVPVDSEQSAVLQCMNGEARSDVEKIILTASGGPFFRMDRGALARITAAQATQHPVWSMGKKISVDSATMFNKGLEIMEAAHLFDLRAEQIDTVIHPEAMIHSMVMYRDGTVIANMSSADMRLPIQYALTRPKRRPSMCSALSLTDIGALHFHAVSTERFPAIRLAYDALKMERSYPLAYDAANAAAVDAFFAGKIRFDQIESAVEETLMHHQPGEIHSVEATLDLHRLVYERTMSRIDERNA